MSEEHSNLHAELEIARILERARRERGLSLQQIEQATKIRAGHLRELEQGNFGAMPGVYTRGFLRTYADYLGLDGRALTRDLEQRQAPGRDRQSTAPGEPAGEEGDLGPAFSGVAAATQSPEASSEKKGAAYGYLLSAREGLRPYLGYLGMAALMVVVLPVIVLALTLTGGDSGPVPIQTPTGDGGKSEAAGQTEQQNGRSPDGRRDARDRQAASPPDRGHTAGGATPAAQNGLPQAQEPYGAASATPAASEPGAAPSSPAASTSGPASAAAGEPATPPSSSAPAEASPAPAQPAPAATAPASPAPAITPPAPPPTEAPVDGTGDVVGDVRPVDPAALSGGVRDSVAP